jgi:predicted O-methyltransferase YrrM
MDEHPGAISHDQLRALIAKVIDQHAAMQRAAGFVPPGHYYSPLPSAQDIERHFARLAARPGRVLPGIDLREREQLALFEEIARYHAEADWPEERSTSARYFYKNSQYGYSDAAFLFCMLRWLRPRRIVEVGSGFSSALMLDIRERFGPADQEMLFVDPNPERLRGLLRAGEQVRVLARPVQDADPATFGRLSSGDLLFIDSSHVSKIGSDVNFLVHEVLPALAAGVWVHVHDMFAGFEYPENWARSGMWWNEQYLMRAFLTFNAGYEIALWSDYLHRFHPDAVARAMPRAPMDPGAQLWLRRK